ncbi:MAG: HD domain-containing phosphohydrolase [Terriglobales bacterium]
MTSDSAAIPTRNDKPRILFVDDDPLALEGLSRSVYREFKADLAEGPEAGLKKVKNDGPYIVVVSDMRMPVMDGAEFLSRVRTLARDSIRVMLTGYADAESAMRAVNEGRIFRFLNKPVAAEDLTLTLRACVAQYDLLRREKELLEKTLAGTIRVLSEVLQLANPVAFNKGARICQYVRHIAGKLCLSDTWQYEIAAMLSELGCLTLTPDLLEAIHAGEALTPEHEKRYSQHPQIAHDLLARIPRLELVADMILQQKEVPTSLSRSLSPDAESVRRGAQMLRVSLAFDRLLSTGSERQDALLALSRDPAGYDGDMVAALADFRLSRGPTELRPVDVRDLRPGMILNQNLRSTTGVLLAAKGHEVSNALVKAVHNFVENGTVNGKVLVTVGKGETWVAKGAAR